MDYKYKIGVIRSDMGGCFQLRIYQPFSELKRFGFDYGHTCFLPQSVYEPPMDTLVKWVEQFDLIVVQRCFKYRVWAMIKAACRIAGRKCTFETDDDYLNIPPYNPCHAEMAPPGALDEFRQILREADHITVTTQELKEVYYLYNSNITVLPNNVESVTLFKDQYVHELDLAKPQIPAFETFGFMSYPSFVSYPVKANIPNAAPRPQVDKLIRIGYTATPTHREDYKTIYPYFEKVLQKYPNVVMFYLGDPWFKENHPSSHKNVVFIPNMPYEMYLQNIRNIDIGIAPLVPDIFNMSKSPLKLLEYGSWGIPAVAPNFVTYNREFTHEHDAMLYHNGKEFYDQMCTMIEDHALRAKLGLNAAKTVGSRRLEKNNAHHRAALYEGLIENTTKHLRFIPTKGTI